VDVAHGHDPGDPRVLARCGGSGADGRNQEKLKYDPAAHGGSIYVHRRTGCALRGAGVRIPQAPTREGT